MKIVNTLMTVAAIAGAASLFPACSDVIHHSETDKQGWFGERKHTEETVYRNPDGSISRERQEIKINP